VELECLLLLQHQPSRAWTAVELGRELRIDEQWSMQHLLDLVKRGLLTSTGDEGPFQYAPKAPGLDEIIRQLAIDYAERRVSVIELIYAKPSGSLQDFSDAFRLRKDPNHG